MSISASVKIIDTKALTKLRKQLPRRIQSKVMRGALTNAAKVVKEKAKGNVRSFQVKRRGKVIFDDKMLRGSMTTVIRRGRRDGELYAVVGPGTEKGGGLAHWVEFGTLAKRTEPLKKPRSSQAEALASKGIGLKKNPFLRTAVEQSRGAVLKVLKFFILTGIEKEVNKVLSRGKL